MQKIIILLISSILTCPAFSQKADSMKTTLQLKGGVTVTNNGISLLPTFSLGKPAAIFDLSIGKKQLFFEPQLRFSLEGKPWSFIFWWRYKLVKTKKLSVGIGAHPSYVFKTVVTDTNGVSSQSIIANRYLATELSPNYAVSKNVSVGIYYLYSHGLDKDAVGNTHFVTINSHISNIKLGNQFFMHLVPQVYYLKMDQRDGFYITNTLTLEKKRFPLSIQTIMNKSIHTEIPGKSFVWNVSLIYSFNKTYVERK